MLVVCYVCQVASICWLSVALESTPDVSLDQFFRYLRGRPADGHLSGDLSARAVPCRGVSAELFFGLFPAGGQNRFFGYLWSIFLFSRIPSAVAREECRNPTRHLVNKMVS